ncbi:hypothetical protein C2S51_036860 [Perilla frutescens var. frutescens]|nr:hypothetical protein C2S51_036860 [Perilla frutescens var. frutescens]
MAKILANVLLVFIFLSISTSSEAQFEDYCIADEQCTEDVLINAMSWACSNGADCSAIQADQTCFLPNTTKDHASYAFNSYYQHTKHNGGTCYFSAAAVLTAANPSHDQCRFDYVP